jgi:hypothetical protein
MVHLGRALTAKADGSNSSLLLATKQAHSQMPQKKKSRQIGKRPSKPLWGAVSAAALSPATLGIAHDLNNRLTGVYSIADLCLHELDEKSPMRERIQMILENGEGAVELIQRLFREHSAAVGREEYHDLNQLLSTNSELIRWAIPKSIEIRKLTWAEPLPIFADAVEFRTLCLYLALGAAAEIGGRGIIQLEAILEKAALRSGKMKRKPQGAGMVLFRLTHSGNSSESKARSAKKSIDPSTDVALSLLSDFARKYSGDWALDNSAERGTTIALRLPRADLQ